MCFSPQRRAFFRHLNFKKCSEADVFCTFSLPNVLFATAACIFRHLNFKKCSEADVFCTFSLQNVLFATAACIFSTSELQKVLRSWRVLYIFTSKCAFRHSGVQFLISPLSSYLRTRRFNRPTFGLTRHTNHWKNTAFCDFSNIWRGCIFFLLTFALLHLLSADLTTPLCFSTVHIVGSFYLNFLRLFFFFLFLLILFFLWIIFFLKSHFQKVEGFGVSSQVLQWKNPRKVAWIQHCHCQCHDDKHHHDGEHHHSHDDGGHNHDHDNDCWRPSPACSHKIM